VLQAIRENDFRAEALGYRTGRLSHLFQRALGRVRHAGGALLALWLRYNGPDTSLSFEIMIDILADGGDRRHGDHVRRRHRRDAVHHRAKLPAGPDEAASDAAAGVPLLPDLVHPDRWLLWLGILFVLSVYRFPTGIVGKLRTRNKSRFFTE